MTSALVAISHGTNSPDGQDAVAALVRAVALAAPDVRVVSGFVDVQQPDVAATLDQLGSTDAAVIVPLLLSAGYHVHVDLMQSIEEQPDRCVSLARSLGPDDRLIEVLVSRLAEVCLLPGDSVVLAAAGSSDHRAIEDCREMARRLAAVLRRPVTVGFLSSAVAPRLPDAIATARHLDGRGRIVLSNYLLAPGFFNDLLSSAGADVVTEPLLTANRPPPLQLVELVLERYRSAVRSMQPAA